MQDNLLSLDEVKSHFEHWRATRTKQRERSKRSMNHRVHSALIFC